MDGRRHFPSEHATPVDESAAGDNSAPKAPIWAFFGGRGSAGCRDAALVFGHERNRVAGGGGRLRRNGAGAAALCGGADRRAVHPAAVVDSRGGRDRATDAAGSGARVDQRPRRAGQPARSWAAGYRMRWPTACGSCAPRRPGVWVRPRISRLGAPSRDSRWRPVWLPQLQHNVRGSFPVSMCG